MVRCSHCHTSTVGQSETACSRAELWAGGCTSGSCTEGVWGPWRKAGGAGVHRPERGPPGVGPRISPSGPGGQAVAGAPLHTGCARTCWLLNSEREERVSVAPVGWTLAKPGQDRPLGLSCSFQTRELYPHLDWGVHTFSIWAKPSVTQASPRGSQLT